MDSFTLPTWDVTASWSDWLIIESSDGSLEDMGYVPIKWSVPQLDLTRDPEFNLGTIMGAESRGEEVRLPDYIQDFPRQAMIEWRTPEGRGASVHLRAEHLDDFEQPRMPILHRTLAGNVEKWWLGKAAYNRARSAGLLANPQQPALIV